MSEKTPTENLPLWMQQARQRVDWGILLVFALSLLAARPFIINDGLPSINALESTLFMTADYTTALLEGRLYPRWTAAAFDGYGAPIPHYHVPGVPYLAAVINVLLLNDVLLAVRVVIILSFCVAGCAAYAFLLRWQDAAAAILGSAVYLYSPYIGFVVPHVLGDLAALLGAALLPLLLWAVSRLLVRNQPFDFTTVVLVGAALILVDLRYAAAGMGLCVAFLMWFTYTQPQKHRAGWVLLALPISLALSSFFWLPALYEQGSVRWQAAPYMPLTFPLTLETLFSPLRRVDLNELIVRPQNTLGLGAMIVTLLAVFGIYLEQARRGWSLLFLVMVWGIIGVMLLWLPDETWLLAPVMLCLAGVCGAALHLKTMLPVNFRRLLLPVLLVIVLAAAIPIWLPPIPPETDADTSQYAQILFEQRGYGVAVLPPGADVPTTLNPLPPTNNTLIRTYQDENTIRLPQSQLGLGRQASLLQGHTHADRYLVNINEATTFDILRAYFPGWSAEINNVDVLTSRNAETGLIRINVPSVRNGSLDIYLDSTPIRRLAWGISWVTVGLLLAGLFQRLRRPSVMMYNPLLLLPNQDVRLLTVVFIAFGGAVFALGTPGSSLNLYPRSGYGLDDSLELRSRTLNGLEALSYELDQQIYPFGDTVELTIAWRTIRPLLRNYSVRVYLQDTVQGIRWGGSDLRYVGGYPTRRWLPNRYIRDFYSIPITSNLRTGEYYIAVEVYDCQAQCGLNDRINFFDTSGQLVGPVLLLPQTITVRF